MDSPSLSSSPGLSWAERPGSTWVQTFVAPFTTTVPLVDDRSSTYQTFWSSHHTWAWRAETSSPTSVMPPSPVASADLDAFLTRLNPARDAHRVAVLHAQQSQRMRRRDLVLARLGTKAGVRANGIGNESCGCTPRRQAGKPHEVTGEAQAARHHFQILTRASRSPVAEGSLPPKRGDSRCSPIALASFILLEVGYKNFPGERRRLVSFLSRGARL